MHVVKDSDAGHVVRRPVGRQHPEPYRGRGIYRALVTLRANEAARRGYTLLQVDAGDDSRPILQRLGLSVVGTTTPYWWRPGA